MEVRKVPKLSDVYSNSIRTTETLEGLGSEGGPPVGRFFQTFSCGFLEILMK